jgi:hypothetical protein
MLIYVGTISNRTYPFILPQQCFLGPLLILKEVDDVLVKNLSMESTVYV